MRAEELGQDVVFAFRALSTTPGYALLVVLTLGLGIAANTLIVSLMTPYVLRELPYEDPDRLVQIGQVDPVTGWDGARFSLPMVSDWRARARSFEDLATYYYTLKNVTGGEGPERVMTGVLSGNLFELLGVEARLGRTFSPEEDGPSGADVVVLSHALWQRRYGGETSIVEREISLDGVPFTVIGVMDETFNFPFGGVKAWIPLRSAASMEPRDRDLHILVGRLSPGAEGETVRRELEAIQSELGALHPEADGRFSGVTVKPMREALNFAYDVMEVSFVVLIGAVFFVLLIACVNVASLTLARTSARSREVAVRSALGAGRARLVRQLLTESLLLALAGGALGVLLASWGARAVSPLVPEDLFRVGDVGVDSTVLLFSLAVTLATPLFFGLAPALSASRASLISALKEGGRSGAGLASMRFRRGLVVGEVAMAIVLVGGTGLMVRSFLELQRAELGFDAPHVLTVEVTLPESDYPDEERRRSYFDRALQEISALGPVRSAGVVVPLPMNHEIWTYQFALPGDAPAESAERPVAHAFRASPGYFEAMGIRLHEGRGFASSDGGDAPRVVVVGRTLAERYWPGRSPLGETLLVGDAESSEPATVVGVVSDVKHDGFETEAPLQLYHPLDQAPSRGRFFVLSTDGSPESVASLTREALSRVDANLPLAVRPMNDVVRESALQWSISSFLLGVFATVALALASLGIYGVMSYSVAARRREIGLRMALGATRRDVSGLVVTEGLRLAAFGLAIGLALALIVARLMASLLYGIGPFDPVTFALVLGVFLAVAILASLLPASRAARTDPIGVLRYE